MRKKEHVNVEHQRGGPISLHQIYLLETQRQGRLQIRIDSLETKQENSPNKSEKSVKMLKNFQQQSKFCIPVGRALPFQSVGGKLLMVGQNNDVSSCK